MTAYDEMNYEGGVFSQTHPQRLQTVAKLFGLHSPSLSTCSVLELGCGDGSNLIPIAYHLPHAKFVGVDLAGKPIAFGNERVKRLKLSNIQLLQADVAELGSSLGKFDYILAHGLYSWVPDYVRPAILKLIQSSLSERGVAYVSFNALPGCRLRHMVRDLIHYRFGSRTSDPNVMPEVRSFLSAFANLSVDENDHTLDLDAPKSQYLMTLKAEIQFALSFPDYVLFHDDLSNFATPFYLHEFARAASDLGLQYLGEASLETMFPKPGSESFSNAAKQWGDAVADPWVAQQQYIDYALGRRFKQALLCHQPSTSSPSTTFALDRHVGPSSLQHFHVRTKLRTQGESQFDASTPKSWLNREVLKFENLGRSISVDEPLAKAALAQLSQIYPKSMSIENLIRGSLGLCVKGGLKYERQASHQAMYRMFWSLLLAGQVELLAENGNQTVRTMNGESGDGKYDPEFRPKVSILIRDAVVNNLPLTGSLHEVFRLDDLRARELVLAMDGTKPVAELTGTQSIASFLLFLDRLGALEQ